MAEANVTCRQAGYSGAVFHTNTGRNTLYVIHIFCWMCALGNYISCLISLSYILHKSTFGVDTDTPAGITNVCCSSSQYQTLLQCSFSTVIPETCDDFTDVIVGCGMSKIIFLHKKNLHKLNLLHSDAEGDRNNFQDNAVRIFHGNSHTPNQGLLQVRCQGLWGSVCLEGFGQVEADSACRQLGYSNAFNFTKS